MRFIFKTSAMQLALLMLSACSTQQLYDASQDLRCQEYYRNEDPHHKTECVKERYEEYQRKREEVLNDKSKEPGK